MSIHNVRIHLVLLLALAMAGCAGPTPTPPEIVPTLTPASTLTAVPATDTTAPTLAPTNTSTPNPTATFTAMPTSSPTTVPTDTPQPSPTPTPKPLPTVTSKPTQVPVPTQTPVLDLCFDAPSGTVYIFTDKTLCSNNSPVKSYDFGVDSSGHLHNWLTSEPDAMRMDYPAKQQYGTVFFTVGHPVPPGNRPGQDLSHCQMLQVDVRADTPNARVQIGMKDANQPDNGDETKIDTPVSTNWETKSFPLSSFGGVTLSNVYILIEFVFSPGTPETIHFRNIRFVCSR